MNTRAILAKCKADKRDFLSFVAVLLHCVDFEFVCSKQPGLTPEIISKYLYSTSSIPDIAIIVEKEGYRLGIVSYFYKDSDVLSWFEQNNCQWAYCLSNSFSEFEIFANASTEVIDFGSTNHGRVLEQYVNEIFRNKKV